MNLNGPHSEPAKKELVPTRASLLARLKDLGDEQSWREFFSTYYRLIYGRVIDRGLSPEDGEDVVAEIVEGVARGMPDFVYNPQRCSFKTWLFRIVENRVADHFRRRARALPRAESDTDSQALLDEVPDPVTLEPDEKWEKAWADNLFQTALDRVRQRANPRYMQIYLYSEVEGHSVPETAKHLQTSVNDVSLAKHRIRELLRDEGDRIQKEEKRREQSVS